MLVLGAWCLVCAPTAVWQQVKALGTSQLATEVLGVWSAAPRAAREDYERFVRLVARLLGGEAPADDVQVSFSSFSQAGV